MQSTTPPFPAQIGTNNWTGHDDDSDNHSNDITPIYIWVPLVKSAYYAKIFNFCFII